MANQTPVVLVDEEDRPIGRLDKMTAHTEGHRHRAISVILYRQHPEHGIQLLLQQRHPNKYHSGNLWTNTCCSHPYPDEAPLNAAHRRLNEELNIAHADLQYLGKIAYEVATGTMIENEIDHVFIGHFDQDIDGIRPHPQEISALKWMAWDTLQTSLHNEPTHYTAWLPHLMPLIEQHIQPQTKQITRMTRMLDTANPPSELRIPTRWVGPIALHSSLYSGNVMVPMSTFESPLWPSVNRGARVSRACTDGIHAILRRDCMTRSVAVAASDAKTMQRIMTQVSTQKATLASVVESTSQHLSFLDCEMDQVGHLGYFRLVINSQNASGHNMVTKAADAMLNWLLSSFEALQYVSISGNLCADKKNAAVNGLRGRGKEVIAEMLIPKHLCQTILHTSPEKIVSLHTRKNLLGSILAGSVRSANAHFANMLLAVYLATGQDAANIVEGSQGITHTEVMHSDLYFSVTLPNIIVGTVGNGKGCAMIQSNLARMGCEGDQAQSAQKLALIIAAAVLCGELSLLAAQTRPGELMRAHIALERSQQRSQQGTHTQSGQTKRDKHDT